MTARRVWRAERMYMEPPLENEQVKLFQLSVYRKQSTGRAIAKPASFDDQLSIDTNMSKYVG